MNYTRQQEQAVRLRHKNLLVSAGAGAGKTRVLADRIVGLITQEESPVSANELLVLTFTNAAAAEMKERICRNLEEIREKQPDNHYLARQLRMLKTADISTVHSFCSRLLRIYFQEIGLDPSFRIGEEGELYLLKQKVMEELLEDRYEAGEEAFLCFVEAYAPDKTDRKLEEMIRQVYEFSNHFPDAKRWFSLRLSEYEDYSDEERFYTAPLCRKMYQSCLERLEECRELLFRGRQWFPDSPEPEKYWKLLQADRRLVEGLKDCKDLKELSLAAAGAVFHKFPRASGKEKDWPFMEEIKNLHSKIKEIFTEEIQPLCIENQEELLKENTALAGQMQVLFSLAEEFGERYFQKKKEQNVYDFDDLEHLTLALLTEAYDEEGRPIPSSVARELQKKYKAIFIDEYQDTNLVQETIIQLLCQDGCNELFAVGDIKQSIYRFRQARPDLFLQRYEAYREDLSARNVRLELRDNFRSGPNVIKACNHLFRRWMTKCFGGVDYTEDVELRAGAGGPFTQDDQKQELLLLAEDESRKSLENPMTDLEGEAYMIGKRIQTLIKEGYAYGDIAILLRSASGYAQVIAACLARQNIPAVCDSLTGYFSSREVTLVLNYLSVVDNVYQDIPLASVLLSSMGGFENRELALIKTMAAGDLQGQFPLYELLKIYEQQGDDPVIKKKAREFLTRLNYFREKKKETPIHVLLWEIYQETGIYRDLLLYPDGEKRRENLLMLMEKAQEYEKTVFKGLFYFVRYMEQLKTYEMNFGGNSVAGTQDNVVRIMTIHKSKGLEFPVVFVSRLQGRFNKMDLNGMVLCHQRWGAGLDYVDLTHRIAHPSFQKKAIREAIRQEALEEELRILYVAMTRAQRKLILTGVIKEDKLLEKTQQAGSALKAARANSYLDWVLAAFPFLNDQKERLEDSDYFITRIRRFSELTVSSDKGTCPAYSLEEFLAQSKNTVRQEDLSVIEKAFSFEYPHREAVKWKRKYSVSELKTLGMQADYLEERAQGRASSFQENPVAEKSEAARRGTVMHKIMERLPFHRIRNSADLTRELQRIRSSYPPADKLPPNMAEEYAGAFLFSKLGEKLRDYDAQGKLRKELPFTAGISSSLIYPQAKEKEVIVVQGVIDLCCETPEGMWLIDYKTDYVTPGREGVLLDRYHDQMLYYRIALEQILGIKVTRSYLYSFVLRKFIKTE